MKGTSIALFLAVGGIAAIATKALPISSETASYLTVALMALVILSLLLERRRG